MQYPRTLEDGLAFTYDTRKLRFLHYAVGYSTSSYLQRFLLPFDADFKECKHVDLAYDFLLDDGRNERGDALADIVCEAVDDARREHVDAALLCDNLEGARALDIECNNHAWTCVRRQNPAPLQRNIAPSAVLAKLMSDSVTSPTPL